jgi:hypothetical protein
MSDWLTCTGLPSVSAAAEADYDPDELAQALIPGDALAHEPGPVQHLDEHLPRGRPSDNRDALRVAVDALREQLERERGRADRLERARDAELEATAKAEAQREYERGRVDRAGSRTSERHGSDRDARTEATRVY